MHIMSPQWVCLVLDPLVVQGLFGCVAVFGIHLQQVASETGSGKRWKKELWEIHSTKTHLVDS